MDCDTRILSGLEDNGKLCRLCLGNEAVYNIFSEESKIVVKLQQCCTLEIFQNDGLPENICRSCVNTIDVSLNFRKLCEENDKILRRNIELLKTQIKNEIPDVKDECDLFDNYENFPDIIEDDIKEIIKHAHSRGHKFKSRKKRKKTLSEIKLKRLKKIKRIRDVKLEINNEKNVKLEIDNENESTSTNRKGFSQSGGLCPFCGKVFEKMSSFNTHVKKHTLTESFACEKCSKSFKELKRLKEHERTHLNIREYSCEVCGKLFGTKSCAKKHLERVHLRSQTVFCKICNKKLAHMNSLRCHMKVHTGERTFECDVCSRKFAFKCSLLVHMRCHTGEKPYSCKFCDSKFAALKTIKEHERLHTGETPYLCPICSKGFTQKSNMKSHFRNNHKGMDMKLEMSGLPV